MTKKTDIQARPVVSFIVAVFNGAQYLQRCIDSVANQSYPDKELIVMDGGSTDGSVDILKHNTDKITYWESKPDHGIYHAWNKALEHSQGDWIAFLGSDDYLWNSQVLSSLLPYMSSAVDDGIRVVYGRVAFVNAKGKVIRVNGEPWGKVRKRFLVEMSIPHPGTLHHRDLFSEYGGFDETFSIVGDYEFLMRELKYRQARFAEDIITTGFQDGGLTNSVHSLQLALRELPRVRRKHVSRGYAITHPSKMYIKTLSALLLYKMIGETGFNRVQRLYRYIKGSR